MTRTRLLICNCPDLAFKPQALAARLGRAGVAVHLAPPLCTPAGLREWRPRLAAAPGEWLLAACGPERQADFFGLWSQDALRVVDLLAASDLEAAASALTLALASLPPPEPQVPPQSREVLVVGAASPAAKPAWTWPRRALKSIWPTLP